MGKFNFINQGFAQAMREKDEAFKIDINALDNAQIIIVSDFFEHQLVGGAEKTLQALIDSCPFKCALLNSSNVTMDFMQKYGRKYWIFGNIANLHPDMIATAAFNLQYSVVMFDFMFCKYRSMEKHKYAENKECTCADELLGKLSHTFLNNSKSLWFMSEKQAEIYFDKFPHLRTKNWTVLSSVFDEKFFVDILEIRSRFPQKDKNNKYLILNSNSWIKGVQESIVYAKENNLEYELVSGLKYVDLLKKMAESKGIIFLPNGGDTCPRFVIEAKLLNCDLKLNDNVMHKNEEWFNTDNIQDIMSYMLQTKDLFWRGIRVDMEYKPTISAYTTTYNCLSSDYPFVECIKSVEAFCDEVIVVDAGSLDGTYEKLNEIFSNSQVVKIYKKEVDLNNPRWAVEIDGHLKAYARSLCTKEYCLQIDADEVVHENDYEKYKYFAKYFPKAVNLVCFPVIEYWGNSGKVRADIHNWKWRLSRNDPSITHSIPSKYRRYDEQGNVYPDAYKSDTCDYVTLNYEPIGFANFYDQNANILRLSNLIKYEEWFNLMVMNLPCVHHYSWFNLKKKIKSTKEYWNGGKGFHKSMYNIEKEDVPENNTMFDKSWNEVTDKDIEELADKLEKVGPRVFHGKPNYNNSGNTVKINIDHPMIMKSWIERNK